MPIVITSEAASSGHCTIPYVRCYECACTFVLGQNLVVLKEDPPGWKNDLRAVLCVHCAVAWGVAKIETPSFIYPQVNNPS